MSFKAEHNKRIRLELKAAGATSWGLMKLESKFLPRIIHDDEHIGAVVYGHYKKHESGMLVATNKRVLFLDRKPLFFSVSDELTYDVVSGVGRDEAGPFSSVTLHTRLGDYNVRLVNSAAAEKFLHFIEAKRLESKNGVFVGSATPRGRGKDEKTTKQSQNKFKKAHMTSDVQAFLLNHNLTTFSSLDEANDIHSSVVYYTLGEDNDIFFITRSTTNKAHNILKNPRVALTVYDEPNLQIMQMQGRAKIETDNNIKQTVFKMIVVPKRYGEDIKWPPITKLEGQYQVIRVTPTSIKFSDFK